MVFSKYYQDELAYLRELGREFAEQNPDSAGHLAEPGTDPDVERLLEGFAFLTARIREKLDDELPEFTHGMLEMFWPHYLRPVPSMTVMQFTPKPKSVSKPIEVPRGAEVASRPVDGTSCTFRIAYDTQVLPISVSEVEVGPSSSPYVLLNLSVMKGASLSKLGLKKLRMHLAGSFATSRALYLTLARYVTRVVVRNAKGQEVVLSDARIEPVGLKPEEHLLPYPTQSFWGFRLLQEYFLFPEKLMFLDLVGLEGLSELSDTKGLELKFELSTLPNDMPPVTGANISLNCAPAVNLFSHDADPIRLDKKRIEYPVRAAGNPRQFETYSVDKVKGIRRADPDPRRYKPFYAFFRVEGEEPLLYKTRVKQAMTGSGTDLNITFLENGEPAPYADETVSIGLTCSNRKLPTGLGLGEIDKATATSPSGASFKNITAPTPPVVPPLEGDVYWSLLSHLSLNYLSLLHPGALASMLGLYDFRARVDRQSERALTRKMAGIAGVRGKPKVRLDRGATIRGMGVEVDLDEEKFGGEGEIYLFGAVLNTFLAHYVSLNAFSQLTVRGKKYGEVHSWPPTTGARVIL